MRVLLGGRCAGALAVVTAVVLTGSACRDSSGVPAPEPPPTSTSEPDAATAATTTVPSSPMVVVAYRVERRTDDPATDDFAAVVAATLADPRGWTRAGFDLRPDPSAPYLVVLAEGPEVDALCAPYQTHGTYSCQNGPVVALNAERWRTATPQWTGDLATYRQMLVNHEVGHLLGQRHPDPQCPEPGTPAPVMAQQSTELDGCLPNPWPLDGEIERAARHDQPMAPGYGE